MVLLDELVEPLTPREREVLACLTAGITTDLAIAHKLCISPHTVHFWMQELYSKLDLTDRAQLVGWAFRTGLVEAVA